MKKVFIVVSIVLILSLTLIYTLIPSTLHISQVMRIGCTPAGTFRYLSDESRWLRWWPSDQPGALNKARSGLFSYNGDSYKITQTLYNTIKLDIHHGRSIISSTIHVLPLPLDSSGTVWECTLDAGINPINRIWAYRQAKSMLVNMASVTHALQTFLDDKRNVYGFDIRQVSTKDTLLLTTKTVFNTYPGTAEIYTLVNTLKNYIDHQHAQQTGNPIMNITQLDTSKFKLMVAIPVNKQLAGAGNIFFTRMVPGQFLVIDVKGGPFTVQEAANQLQLYFSDYHRTSMAIPFQELITDRVASADTTIWKTRIHQPVY